MPSLHTLLVPEFTVVNDNLDVDLIAPILLDLKLLSSQDNDKLVTKTRKAAIKLIINRAKEHADGAELLFSALERSKKHKGHQKILLVLYPGKSLMQGIVLNLHVTVYCIVIKFTHNTYLYTHDTVTVCIVFYIV